LQADHGITVRGVRRARAVAVTADKSTAALALFRRL
jgi:hypothetical protein